MSKRGSLTALTNPSGSVIQRDYGSNGGVNDRLSRPQHLRNPADADPAVSYLYAGLAWIIEAACAEPGVRLTQHNLGGMTIGDGGDQYVGVDRFGQLEELRWHRISSPTTWLEHLTFGYNKSGSRLWRENLLFGNTEDELYAYDGLYQLLLRQRGNLTNDKLAIAGTPQREEALAFDPLGNWTGYNAKALGTSFLTQTRTHNPANQITALANSVPAVTPLGVSHDAAGNIVQAPPDPDGDWTKGFKLTWDAWNRIVKVRNANDNSEVATFQYDALFRRTVRKVGGTSHHEYWDAAWHLVEERIGSSSQPSFQFLWGLRGHNDLVRRDDTTSAPGGEDSSSSGSSPSSRLYVLSDGMSPTAILDRSGTLLERQSFSAFGLRRLLAPNGSDRATSILSDWRFAFQGQFDDSETGLANYGLRYYSPQLGRWLRRDPIGEKGGVNLYGYVRNNGVNFNDHFGLEPRNPTYLRNTLGLTAPVTPGRIDPLHPHWAGTGMNCIRCHTPPPTFESAERMRLDNLSSVIDQEAINTLRGDDWLSYLPDCECSIPLDGPSGCPTGEGLGDDWSKPAKANTAHPGGTWEVRWTHPKYKTEVPGQQCIYDACGNLITKGRGAGTPDKRAFDADKREYDPVNWGHDLYDFFPFLLMMRHSIDFSLDPDFYGLGLEFQHEFDVSEYLKIRPPNNGNECPENDGASCPPSSSKCSK